MLISPDSLASDYFYDKEVANALVRHHAGECRVVPVIVRDCMWEATELAELQALPKDALPIALWQSPDAAYKSIAVGVAKLVEDLKNDRLQAQYTTENEKAEKERLKREAADADLLRLQNKNQFRQQLQDADDLYAQQKYTQAQTAYHTLLNCGNKTDLGYTDAQPHLTCV